MTEWFCHCRVRSQLVLVNRFLINLRAGAAEAPSRQHSSESTHPGLSRPLSTHTNLNFRALSVAEDIVSSMGQTLEHTIDEGHDSEDDEVLCGDRECEAGNMREGTMTVSASQIPVAADV